MADDGKQRCGRNDGEDRDLFCGGAHSYVLSYLGEDFRLMFSHVVLPSANELTKPRQLQLH